MMRSLLSMLALAIGSAAFAADPDPRSPKDIFGQPREHGPVVNKAFLGLYTGRTNLFFGQPMSVELFAIPVTGNGPYIHPHLPHTTLALVDDAGKAVPFQLQERGYSSGSAGEFNWFQLLPTKAHSIGGYWKPGRYTLAATVVNVANPTNPKTAPGAFVSNSLKFVVSEPGASGEVADPKRKLSLGPELLGAARFTEHFWLHAAGLDDKSQEAERTRLELSKEAWGVGVARFGEVLVPQDRPLTNAETTKLVASLKDTGAGVRMRAVRGVPRGAENEVVAALLERLIDRYEWFGGAFGYEVVYPIREAAGEALVRLGPGVAPALVTLARSNEHRSNRGAIARLLGKIGHHPDAEKWLLELLDSDSDDLQYSAQAAGADWGKAGDDLSRQVVARPKLRKEIRRDAITALGASGDLKTDGPLLRPLLASTENDVQWAAVAALAKLKDIESLPAFEKIARDSTVDQNTRYPAVDAVLRFAAKDTGDKLLLELMSRPDDRLRAFAMLRAGGRKLDAALPTALAALDDKDWYTRVMADNALRGLADNINGVGYDPMKPDSKVWREFWAKKDKK